ncbi:MAG: hypothetical protein ACRECH_03375 [Nitrososphaerales archaeon]
MEKELRNPSSSSGFVPRKEEHRKLIVLCVIFGTVAVALSLLELTVVVAVFLFFDLFLLAFCLSILILSETALTRDPIIKRRNNDSENVPYHPRNRVDSFSVYVKYASKGSDFSRREIAVTLKRILVQRFGMTAKQSPVFDRRLSEDLGKIVFPYVSNSLFALTASEKSLDAESDLDTAQILPEPKSKPAEDQEPIPQLERQAYLSSVERVITKLQNSR